MTYCEPVFWTLFGSAIGAGLSVWLAIAVERYNVRLRFKRLKDFAGTYVASEVRDGITIRELFWVKLDLIPNNHGVLRITGLSRVKLNPEFTGELIFADRLRSASGSYVHDGNPNMFGFFDVQVLAGQQASFHVHQRFIKSGVTTLRNEVWNRYSGPVWVKHVPEQVVQSPSSDEEAPTG